jgi:hypothetical protein
MLGIVKIVTPGDPVLGTQVWWYDTFVVRTVIRTGSQLRHSIPTGRESDLGRRTKPILSADYVVGLTDGEGCFYVNIWKSSAYRAGAGVQVHFHIKLSERDRELLEAVRETFGCGAVYYQKETRVNHTQCYRYTVHSQRDIIGVVIPFFQQYPLQLPSKRSSFKIFCQIVNLVEQKRHLTKEGIEEIRKLKAMMNQRVGLA